MALPGSPDTWLQSRGPQRPTWKTWTGWKKMLKAVPPTNNMFWISDIKYELYSIFSMFHNVILVILYSLSHEPPKGCLFLSTCYVLRLCHTKGCVGSGMVKFRRRISEPKCHSVHFIDALRIGWGQTVPKSYPTMHETLNQNSKETRFCSECKTSRLYDPSLPPIWIDCFHRYQYQSFPGFHFRSFINDVASDLGVCPKTLKALWDSGDSSGLAIRQEQLD